MAEFTPERFRTLVRSVHLFRAKTLFQDTTARFAQWFATTSLVVYIDNRIYIDETINRLLVVGDAYTRSL